MTGEGAPRILVVDDDPPILRMIQLTLQSEGFRVSTAPEGQTGLAALEDQQFDLLVLDLQMPVLDGRAMYRELRARGHDVPTLVLSAFGAEAAREELGAEAALRKPFDIEELIRVINAVLAATRAPRVKTTSHGAGLRPKRRQKQ